VIHYVEGEEAIETGKVKLLDANKLGQSRLSTEMLGRKKCGKSLSADFIFLSEEVRNSGELGVRCTC